MLPKNKVCNIESRTFYQKSASLPFLQFWYNFKQKNIFIVLTKKSPLWSYFYKKRSNFRLFFISKASQFMNRNEIFPKSAMVCIFQVIKRRILMGPYVQFLREILKVVGWRGSPFPIWWLQFLSKALKTTIFPSKHKSLL